jgi:hypothetical protein
MIILNTYGKRGAYTKYNAFSVTTMRVHTVQCHLSPLTATPRDVPGVVATSVVCGHDHPMHIQEQLQTGLIGQTYLCFKNRRYWVSGVGT